MKRLIASTTALSMAFAPLSGVPAFSQTMLEDGSVVAKNGRVLCTPTPEVPCDLEAIKKERREAAKAAREAKAAEAAAAEQAAAEAVAAQEAAAAEAAAAAQAADEAAAAEASAAEQAAAEAAAAEAAAAAEQAAAEQAAADAAAEAAAADAAAAERAAAEAAAADAEAAERAAAEATAAEADAAGQAAAEEAAAAEAAAAEAAAASEAAAAEDAAAEQAQAEKDAARKAKAQERLARKRAREAAEAEAQVGADGQPATDATALETAPAEPAAPVEVPVPDVDAVAELEALLGAPTVTEEAAAAEDGAVAAGTKEAAAPAAEAAKPAVPLAARQAARKKRLADQAAANAETAAPVERDADGDEVAPVSVVEDTVTEADTRSSDEEFAAAPTEVADGKKSGLSDLEKVGLVALGALVVGAILSNNREVVQNTGDRVVVRDDDGRYVVYKDDDALLRRPGVNTTTETFRDGSTRTVVDRADGTQIVTIRDASGRVLRRAAYDSQGRELVLIDDLQREEPIQVADLPRPRPSQLTISTNDGDAELKAELAALEAAELGRTFSLRQVREIREVRALAATIEVDNITFDSGSSVIRASEAPKLADLGRVMGRLLDRNPGEVFLIEGHTDAVGGGAMNLALSDRRAESVALALTEYFDIPPENLVVQGYGESELKIATQGDERANRRATIRLITPLLRVASN